MLWPVSVSARALWFVELHLHEDLSLDRVADAAGVSRFHLSRAFGAAIGTPLAAYVRGRRLSRAASALASGAPDILAVALEAGYGSHEAFTRAFSQQFGATPEQVRERGHVGGLAVVPPLRLDQPATRPLEGPRLARGALLRMVGVSGRHADITGLPTQWSRVIPYVGHIAGQVGQVVYGVSYNLDDAGTFDYLCGVEVSEFPTHPPELTRLTIPPQTYAVFTHRDHIASVATSVGAIIDHALSDAGYTMAEGPFLERYDERFDHRTGLGGFELWFPLAGEA